MSCNFQLAAMGWQGRSTNDPLGTLAANISLALLVTLAEQLLPFPMRLLNAELV